MAVHKKLEDKLSRRGDNVILNRLKREIREIRYTLQYANSRRYEEYEMHRRRKYY